MPGSSHLLTKHSATSLPKSTSTIHQGPGSFLHQSIPGTGKLPSSQLFASLKAQSTVTTQILSLKSTFFHCRTRPTARCSFPPESGPYAFAQRTASKIADRFPKLVIISPLYPTTTISYLPITWILSKKEGFLLPAPISKTFGELQSTNPCLSFICSTTRRRRFPTCSTNDTSQLAPF